MFLKVNREQIYNVKLFYDNYLYWPDLDIDINLESIKHPHLYPLKFI